MEFFYAMVVSWFAADHGKNTRSIMTTIWNNTTPITDSRIKEPNATGVLKNAVAVMIIYPNPLSALTNSPTTAPTTAYAIAALRPLKINGTAYGRRIR